MSNWTRNGSGYYDPTATKALRNIAKGEKKVQAKKGDIFFVKKKGYVEDSEQESGRPAIIVSNDIGNNHSSICEVVFLTTQDKNPLPTHVKINCRVPSTALCEQITTISQDRLLEYVRSLTEKEMKAIDNALMISLGISEIGGVTSTTSSQDAAMIDDLMMKLEGAERELDELKKQPVFPPDTDEIVRLKAQIEILEKQNEKLLDRLIG